MRNLVSCLVMMLLTRAITVILFLYGTFRKLFQIFFISCTILYSQRLPAVVSATSPTSMSCVLPGHLAEGFSDRRTLFDGPFIAVERF